MRTKQRWRWFSLLLFLIIAFLAGNHLIPKEWAAYTVDGDTLRISYVTSQAFQEHTEYSFSILLDNIASYAMVDADPDAVLLRGSETRQYQAGLLTSRQYGTFEGCLCQKSEQAVLLETSDGRVYMASLEDSTNTAGFFAGLERLMEDYRAEKGGM